MYPTLIGELAKQRITQKQLAKELGIHVNTVRNKLQGGLAFDVGQCITIYKLHFTDSQIPWYELFEKG